MVSDELIMVDKPEQTIGEPVVLYRGWKPSYNLWMSKCHVGYNQRVSRVSQMGRAKKKHKNEHVVSKTTWYYPLDFDHRGFFQGHFHDFRLMEIDGRGIWDTGNPCPPNIGSTLPWVGSWLGQVFQGLCHLRDGNKQETCSKDVSKIYVGIVWIVIVIGLKSEAQKKVRCN